MAEVTMCGVGRIGATARRRVWSVCGVASLFAAGYFGVAAVTDPGDAGSLATALDARVPFLPVAVLLYLTVYPACFAPALLVRSDRLFRRLVAADVSVMIVSFSCFALWPVSAAELRPALTGADPLQGLVAWLYAVDPPVNLFPSLHLALATLSAEAIGHERPRWRLGLRLWLVAVALAAVAVKQHFVADVVAGTLLGGLAALGFYGRGGDARWRGDAGRLAPALLGVVLALPVVALEPVDADEVRRAWRTRLDGRHFTATIRLVLGSDQGERVLVVWRDDEGGTRERLLARFREPFDLRGVSVLYLEQQERPNDYFLYQPQTKRIRRVPEGLAREDLYGVDLEFLGFDVAGNEATIVEALEPVEQDGRKLLRLVERPREANPRFDHRTVWLDATSFVPMRSEYRRDGAVTLRSETLQVREVQGIPTPVHLRFAYPGNERTTDLYIEEIDYEKPIEDSFFSTLALTKRWQRTDR